MSKKSKKHVECLQGCMWVEEGEIYPVVAEDKYGVYVDDIADGTYEFSWETENTEWKFVDVAPDWSI